jgi:outer membrane receptor protein involved in Fe transport
MNAHRMVALRVLCALALGLGAVLALSGGDAAWAQETGTITGKVTEGGGKQPVPYANVVLPELRRGMMTGEDGTFTLPQIPIGTYEIRAMMVGFDPVTKTVTVVAGEAATVSLDLGGEKVTKQMDEIVVTAEKLIDTKTSTTKQQVSGETLSELPVENLEEAVALKAGVVAQGGELHFRGGRAGEVRFQVDGVEVTNSLNNTSASVANLSVATAEVLSGGFDAEYGNALSGIVSVQTKEGGRKFGGEVQWHTDRYGEATKTYNNYDRFTFGFGGPTPITGFTYYLTYEGTWTDTYLAVGKTQPRQDVFDFFSLGNRQWNDINTNLKLAYTMSPRHKLTFEVINNRSERTPYNHMWSREGFVEVNYDTTYENGEMRLNERFGRWSFFEEDSTFRYVNMADHIPTVNNKFLQMRSVWTHSLSSTDVYTIRAALNTFKSSQSVAGKEPWEYYIRSPFYWSGNLDDNPYFATHGDFPTWFDRTTNTFWGKGDYTTQRWKGHTFKTGGEFNYNEFQNLSLVFPNQESQGLPGLQRSDFINYNPEFSFYVQDRWEYEGLVLNAGARFDAFTPGAQIPDEDLVDPQTGIPGERWKTQVSPRLGIAYPISDRDVLSFHYGWTFQTPARTFVFENRASNSNVAIRGNPNLEPETNIAYQAGVQHLFSKDVSGQFSVFFKDIFGLIAVRQVRDETSNLLVPTYVNQDYASARGFEASLVKRFSHKFSGELNYTYSIATGVASDPNQGLQFANGNLLFLPISERALDWDQRHTLSASLVIREPSSWGLNILWTFGSGFPYTPTFRNDRTPDPRLENSRRLPSQSTLSVVADKFYNIWGQRVTFFLDARNLLDSNNIGNLSFGAFPNPYVNTIGDDYLIYYTETGRPGGAYLQDTNGDGIEDWVPVNDPRVWQEGRNIRIGVGVAF